MGKRKFDGDAKSGSKKSKSDDNDETENHEEQPQEEGNTTGRTKASRGKMFDIKHFRKELTARQGQTMALTQFLQVCLNPDSDMDYMLEYLRVGGNSHEILRQISQDNKKNLTLATPTFHLFHLIILKVQSTLPHMITITEEACRYFLNTFVPTVEIMISENSGPRHRKIILNLLTSMVTLSSDLGVEVLTQVPLTPKNLQYIVEKPNYKEKDNVRTAFVHFMTSFLVDGHLPLIKALLEKQGLLPLIIPGLVQDEPDAVLMFLNILKKNVIDNVLISKTLKLKTFSHQVLHNMFKVFMWKGPPEYDSEQKNESKEEIMTLLSNIILTIFTSHKLGVYFIDHSLGTSDANKNQNLYKALLTLKRPWENEYQCEVVLQIIYKCPDLHRAIINVIEQSFQPQHSPIWERAIEFVIKLLDKLRPEDMMTKLSNLNASQTSNFIRFITMPVPLLKLLGTGIGKDQTVSLYSIKVIVKMMQTLKRYMQILELEDTNVKINELKNKLDNFIPKHMPTPNVIVSLINDLIENSNSENMAAQDYKLPKLNNTDALLSLIDLLLSYNYVHPSFMESLEGNISMKKILDFSMTLSSGPISLLKFKVVSLWLMLDSSALTLKNPMFKELFLIMLEVYTSEEDDTWIEAKDTLYIFFKNTEIFEADEDEIHLMLYTLRNSKVNPISLIGDIIEHVLANGKELTDFVRDQIVNFEISDENSKDSLDKLFKDLMNNRKTEDSIFLETKIPSTFIVGCMQFIQNSREAKKSLKSFLGLYVANLLHCNYSPELTEVLIGDSKLDVRGYVADWTVKPVNLPETTSKDEILTNISKSIIEKDVINLPNIFPFLIESSEEYDLRIMDSVYKIDVTKNVNSSDLFIWAKYLMFCLVRMTNLTQFTSQEQKKIGDYFKIIIALGKKHHMLNVCRNIVLTLFKNAHCLKIYQPIDFNKNTSTILATKLILQIIEENDDIINYLNKKHFILKAYQQKNYDEIVKAFIKINKRKNVNCEHTIKVVEVVGLSKDDDVQVLNQIFSAEIGSCIKEDKEPSLVLELLRVLLDKYSKTISLEISQDMMKKCFNLYTELLTMAEVTPNLTNLEEALAKYFESKPHQVILVSDEDFGKFFNANAVRKTTSYLASILLGFNEKLCNVFMKEIERSDILSQREITLPLGNAIIKHTQFLLQNKHILAKVYEEYKSNIIKVLEKPHKAGQVYINSWKFIRKLIVECMDLQDCKKFFAKSHKFETVEINHLLLVQAVFFKLLLNEGHKKEFLINYFLSMLNSTTLALKENKDVIVLNEMIVCVDKVINLSKITPGFQDDQKEDFKKITESGIWQGFCKTILKESLKIKTAEEDNAIGPKLLCLLSSLVKLFYPNNHEDIVSLFDMVTSHSEFLNVMLSHHSPEIKSRLLEFIFVLISTNKSVMKTQQIPVYLSAYRATRSPGDRLILTILQFYESNDLPVNEYKPYVWGDSAANYYAVRKNRTSTLWGHPTPNQVVNLFEKEVIERTIRHFPVNQKLDYNYELPRLNDGDCSLKKYFENILRDSKYKSGKDNEAAIRQLLCKDELNEILMKAKDIDIVSLSHVEEDDGIYDPAFLFPLLSHLLAPGSVASCFKLLRIGLLSIPVMGLSSHCPLMRAAAYHVLHRFCMLLETETRHKNDKLLLTDFITTLKQSLSTAISVASDNNGSHDAKNPKLPAIGALYLARALMVATSPSEPLYKPVNNFLIAKQFVDLTVVPDFLSLFHDSEVEAVERRMWVLDIIADGTKTMTDVNVVFKTMCLKMIMDIYNTVLCDKKSKLKILNALNAVVAIPRAFEILVEGYGFMSWLHHVVRNIGHDDKNILREMFVLIENMIYSVGHNIFHKYCSKFNVTNDKIDIVSELMNFKVKTDIEYEILSIVYDMLPRIKVLDIEDALTYVKLYNIVTKRSIKFLTKKQVTTIVETCSLHCKNLESVKFIQQAVVQNNYLMLSSKNVDAVNDTAVGVLINELGEFVQTYVT